MEHKLKSNMAVMFHDVLSGVSRGNGDSTIAISVAIRDDIPRVTLKGQRIVYGSVTQVFLSNYVYEGAPVETHCFIQSRTPDDRSGILLYTDKTAYPYVTCCCITRAAKCLRQSYQTLSLRQRCRSRATCLR